VERPDGAVLRSDRHRHPLGLARLVGERSLGLDPLPGERLERVEHQPLPLLGVLHPRLAQVGEDGGDKALGVGVLLGGDLGPGSLLVGVEHPVR